jgi:hypothetical protein
VLISYLLCKDNNSHKQLQKDICHLLPIAVILFLSGRMLQQL